jgi:hypothetical protein
MGAAREGCDLLNKNGRYVFFRDLFKRRRFNRLVWRDTFGRALCWLSGEHISIRQDLTDHPIETSCSCCCRWLVQDGYKWRVKRLSDYQSTSAVESK